MRGERKMCENRKIVSLKLKKVFLVILTLAVISMLPMQALAAKKMNKSKVSLAIGQQYQLKVTGTKKRAKWSSSNKKVVSVTSNGRIRARKAGKCTITAKERGKKNKCVVTVKKAAVKKATVKKKEVKINRIDLNTYSVTMNKGTYRYIYASVYPSNATNKNLQWSSSNPNVVQVSYDGCLTAISAGTATITVMAQDGSGEYVTCQVTVVTPFVYLTSLRAYNTSGEIKSVDYRSRTDIFGKVYNHYLGSNGLGNGSMSSKASKTYRIDGKYSQMTGTFFLPVDRSNVSPHYVSVLGDGVVLYQSYVRGGSSSLNFSINISGVQDLTVVMYGNNNWETILGEPVLYG